MKKKLLILSTAIIFEKNNNTKYAELIESDYKL